jgi:hypothetical protein
MSREMDHEPHATFGLGADLVEKMDVARTRIEERFLEGGAALLTILDVLNKLIATLDGLTGSLDEETANATMVELQQTVERLSELSRIERDRQDGFGEIAQAEQKLKPHVADMQETMRYLRTFAVTAKITGAGIADFAGFAEEILDRIHAGTRQVDEFGDKLKNLGAGLGSVRGRAAATIRQYEATVPGIVADLLAGGAAIGTQRATLVGHAAQVRRTATGIQGKLASTLSAMQIGDITRQRIEHCQATLTLLENYLRDEGLGLSRQGRQDLFSIITNLVSRQLDQSIADFERDTSKIVKVIASFRSDLKEIDDLRGMMAAGGNESAMHHLESLVGTAREAVRQIEDLAGEAEQLSRSTGITVGELINGVDLLQLVRTDIHYMALNTNLRCGKIGEHGKALNVVTAELRNFAGRLDETAEKVLVELKTLEKASEKIESGRDDGRETLDARLDRAMQNIRTVGDRMEFEMDALATQSDAAIGEMESSLARLDFSTGLGDVLHACSDEISRVEPVGPSAELEPALAELGGRIARLYTMVSEREVHAAFLGTAVPVEPVAVAAVMSDDDLEDALF